MAKMQYLGAGDITVALESPESGTFVPIHIFKFAGRNAVPTFRNPTFHMNMIAKTEAGFAGAAQTIKTSSLAGFIEGKEADQAIRKAQSNEMSTDGTEDVVVLYLHNGDVFQGTRNKVVCYPDFISVINEATKPIFGKIIRNPTNVTSGMTLSDVDANNSVMTYANSAGGGYLGGEEMFGFAVPASDSKGINISDLDMSIRPTDRWAFVATKKTGGADGLVTIGCSWKERI